jgi:alkyl sulfatase BDS1-like metallo-beta-lactamase superfamily hydrolase
MSQLNAIHGLFKVAERVYQVRGFSLANVTFIEGDTGLIVVDPLQFTEHARAAIELYREHRALAKWSP